MDKIEGGAMKVTLNKVELEETLFYASKTVVRSKAIIVSQQGIQFLFKDNKLYLYSYNGLHCGEVYYGEVVADNFSCLLEYSLIEKVISLSEAKELELTFDDDALTITDSDSEYRIQYMQKHDISNIFDGIDVANQKQFLEMDLADFRDIYSFVSPCIPTQAGYVRLRGVYYDGNFMATNTTGFAYYPFSEVITDKVFMSLETFQILSSIAPKGLDAFFYMINGRFVATIGRSKYILSLLNSDFPDYAKVMERVCGHEYTIKLNKSSLIKKCKKLGSFTSKYRRNSALLTVSENELVLEVMAETKRGKEKLDIETEGLSGITIEFSIDLLRLVSYLAHVFNETISITCGKNLNEFALKDGQAVYVDGMLK